MDSALCETSTGHDIVISGFSGRFPESADVDEFYKNLLSHVDMIVDDESRFPLGYLGIGKFGKVKDLSSFDNEFFSQPNAVADNMSPDARICLEMTYEAIIDAGESLSSLANSRTGVFLNHTSYNSSPAFSTDWDNVSPYILSGCLPALIANRISNVFNFSGPSIVVDTACSSSHHAFDYAYRCLRDGIIDTAIVGGLMLDGDPLPFLQYVRSGFLSPDRQCKSFDASGNGFTKAEGGAIFVLQRRRNCKRCYATMVHSLINNDGKSVNGFLAPDGQRHHELIRNCYAQAEIDPLKVVYLETHGTGTVAGDPEEILGLTTNDLMTRGRKGPLLIGSVKSNCGHAEWSSGLISMAKVILSIKYGTIPANLHFNSPNPKIKPLLDGRVKVLSENTPYEPGYVGINSFGLGGSNGHIILGPPETINTPASAEGQGPRLFTYGARTEDGARKMLEFAQKNSHCIELQALLAPSSNMDSRKMPYRAYVVLNDVISSQEIQKTHSRPPVCLVFPGAGCNWTNMHQGMMRLPLFKEAVDRASKYAKEKHGIEIFPANPGDPTLALLQIAVIQIALVDILKAVGIEGDYFFGHSNGEVACGYATGCLTLEQAVSLAYARSLVSVEGRKILKRGKMAAVGLSWEECTKRCPPGVIPACHNAADSVTISGEADRVTKFVEQLVSEGVFAREVDSQGTAYHTPEISQLDAFQEEILSPIIPNAKKRPANWWSTSFPESQWGRPEARDCSVQYYTHNSKNPVYFHEAVLKIPKGSLVIEIGPHGLLMPVVKRTCGESIIPVTLMRRNEANNVSFCLSALGKCYLHGIDINPLALHSPVQFPVPLSTPIISPALAKIWDHSAKWRVPHYTQYLKSEDATNFLIHLESGAEFEYLTDHRFNDEPMLPASACLVMAWKAYAKKVGKSFDSFSVQLSDVTFSQQPIVLAKGAPTTFKVQVSKQSGQFEVSQEGEGLLCQGVIKSKLERNSDVVSDSVDTRAKAQNVGTSVMNKSDFYTFFRTQGYEHTGRFEGVIEASLDFSQFSLEWNGNWILFLDYIMQTTMSKKSQGKRCLPYKLKSLEIDAVSLPVVTSSPINLKTTVQGELTECTGVRLSELKVYELTQTSPVNSSMDITAFMPYTETPEDMFDESLRSYSEDCLRYILHQLKNVSHTLLSRWFSRKVVEELSSAKSHKTSASLDHYLHSEDCVLARYLKNVFTCCRDKNETKMAEIFTELETTLFKDRLFSSMNSDQILKPCLDIITDNLNVYSMSIFEIDGGHTRVFPRIINLLKHEPKCAFSYSIGAARVIHDKEAAELGVQEVIWDFGSSNSVVKTNSCHLVIARNALHKQKDPKEALLQAKDLVCQEGFLLVEEITDAFPLGYMIDGFKSKFEDAQVNGRHLGVFLDDKQWKDLFKSCNLELIYKKANNIMSTIYLLRKMTPNIQRPILIAMEHTSMTWLNQLKSALQEIEQSAEGTKIWLVASDQSGVSGFMKSLKSEGYGRHVRYILVSNMRSGSPVPELTKDCEAMTNLIKKDLHSNVYRDGQWGTFSLLPYTPSHTICGADAVKIICFCALRLARVLCGYHNKQPSLLFPTKCYTLTEPKCYTLREPQWYTLAEPQCYTLTEPKCYTLREPQWYTLAEPATPLILNCISTCRSFEYISCVERGELLCGRHRTIEHYRIQTNHAFLHKPASGTPQTIDWVESSLLKDTHVTPLTTNCIGLENEEFEQNVKDGSKTQNVDVMGFDVSGRLEDGRRVMACVASAAQTQLDISKGISLHIPDHWSFEEAATVPMSYSRAYYSLGLVTDLVKGDNVLVAGAGHPIGQAVLTLTLASGYSTFALVDDSKEKSYVCNLFPQLDPQRVVCAKDPDHVQQLIAVTENRGLDVIFNAYTDRTPSDVVELLARGGHFVQVRPTSLKSRLIRSLTEKMASVSIADLHRVLNSADEKSLQIKKGIADRITEGISEGIVKPLDHIVYKTDEVETVIRDVANKLHNKKIIIKVQDGRPEALLTKPKLPQISARKRALCHPKRSYVIIGGLGGFGLELAHWLVKRGCRYVVLSSRRGLTTGYQQYKVNLLRSLGVTVLTSTEASVSLKSASALLAQASNLAPLGGIFNASMVNSDEMFDKMTNELFQAACEPKVNATSHFDQLTRELCKDTSVWFVTFSSQTSARGNPAQTNYAYANSFMERVCEKRVADGLHGLAIQWGWIGSVGTVVKRLEEGDFSTQYISQYLPQSLDSCFDCMEQALVCGHPVVGVFVKNTLQTSHVNKDNDTVKQSILDQVVKILALKDPDSLTDSITLQDVGIDSIMTSEVKQLLEKSVNVSLSNKEVKTLTFQKLREMDASR